MTPCSGIWADDQARLGRGAFDYRHCSGCVRYLALRGRIERKRQHALNSGWPDAATLLESLLTDDEAALATEWKED